MSMFDPDAFLHATTTEASTRRPPIPAGLDFVGTIGEVKARAWQSKDGTKSGIAFDVPIRLDLTSNPEVAKACGTDAVTLTDGIMLDVTEGGTIDYSPGKNSKLRRYRDALGLNVAGQPFSPASMTGRLIRAKIKHDLYEGEVYDKVDSVAKA